MKLYHFSNIKLDKITVDKFGVNSYTRNDKKYNVKRSFFYTCLEDKERIINGAFCHVVNIPDNKIYNLIEDKNNLKSTCLINGVLDIEKLLNELKKDFKGVLYNIGFNCVCLFDTVEVLQIIEHVNA